MSSSETGPAVIPSGGLVERFLYSWKRRFWATEDAIFAVDSSANTRVGKYLGGEVVCGDLGGMKGGDGIIPGRWTKRGDVVARDGKQRLKDGEVNGDIFGLRVNTTSKTGIL